MKARSLLLTAAVIFLFASPSFARRKKPPSLMDAATAKVEEALVKAPADNETCFPPDEPCNTKLWKFMRTAQKSLDIAIYDINEPKIVHEILVASKRIPVRIIVDRRQAKGTHSLVSLLIKAGANLRYGHQRGIMHDKFTLVDAARLETGSYNYTVHATEANNENQVYLGTPSIVKSYQARFDQMWNEADPAPTEMAAKR